MATTTNYAWETPDDTDLVKDGAAAIRTLGSSIDTTTKALNPSTTLGDIEYRSSTANTNTRLGIGSTGNVLTVSGGVPVWAAPAGGGKVLQVVQGTTSTAVSNSTDVYADTNLTASITPTLSTSKVLVMVMQNGISKSSGNSGSAWVGKLMRNTTDLTVFAGYELFTAAATTALGSASTVYLDSPATTSSITYKTRFKNLANAAAVSCQDSSASTSTITLLEIGA